MKDLLPTQKEVQQLKHVLGARLSPDERALIADDQRYRALPEAEKERLARLLTDVVTESLKLNFEEGGAGESDK